MPKKQVIESTQKISKTIAKDDRDLNSKKPLRENLEKWLVAEQIQAIMNKIQEINKDLKDNPTELLYTRKNQLVITWKLIEEKKIKLEEESDIAKAEKSNDEAFEAYMKVQFLNIIKAKKIELDYPPEKYSSKALSWSIDLNGLEEKEKKEGKSYRNEIVDLKFKIMKTMRLPNGT